MIKPEDEVFVDFRTSCNKDEAVAKLLGWLKGPLHPKSINVTEKSFSEDQLVQLSTLEDSLETQLQELRDSASRELTDAAEAESSDDVLKEMHNAVERIDELIRRAFFYMSELTDELSKEAGSRLKIDQDATEKTGQQHITLKSLNDWANNLFSITILDHADRFSTSDAIKGEDDEDEDVPDDGNDYSGIKQGLGNTKAKHLYVTLTFLVEALMKASKKSYGSDTLNVDVMAGHLHELAEARISEGKKKYQGQSSDAIVKRINQAFNVRNHHEKNL